MVAWLAIAAIASVFGAATSAISTYQQGVASSRMASYNAMIARQNADLALQKQELSKIQTRITEKREREKTKELIASQRTAYGKAGVVSESGTPLMVMADTAAEGELDALAIRYAGSIEEASIVAQQSEYRQQAKLAEMRGRASRQAGGIGAGTELLTGVGKFADYMDRGAFKSA